MDYSKLHWSGDFMASEMGYVREDDEENDFAVGIYSPIDFPEVYFAINVEKGKIIEVWLNN